MHMDQLDYLVEIHKSRSLSEASRKLHLTVQALSMSVKALEEELNLELLVRSHQGVIFTEKGLQLINLYEQFHQGVQTLLTCSQEKSEPKTKENLIVLVNYCGVVGFLPQLLCDFYQQFPDLNVIVREIARHDILHQVSCNKAEFGLVYHFCSIQEVAFVECDELEFTPLFQAKMICQVSKYSSLAKRKKITLKEALSHAAVVYQPAEQSTTSLLDILQPFGDTQQVMITNCNSIYTEMIINNNRLGFNLTIPYGIQITQQSDELINIPVTDYIKVQFGYVIRKNRMLSKNAQIFLNNLLEESYEKPNFNS